MDDGKIIDAQDILADAQGCIECIFMAANELTDEGSNPIQTVANIASMKIGEAIALLDEYRGAPDARPVPDTPPAEPVTRAARTKRKGK
jgi:hypothetical protein